MNEIHIRRLSASDVATARQLFATMADVFETEAGSLSDGYLTRLLQRADFWALMATVDGQVASGLTAYTLRSRARKYPSCSSTTWRWCRPGNVRGSVGDW